MMAKMKRRLFNIAAGLSMVLCVTTAVLWARSYWVTDGYNWVFSGNAERYTWLELQIRTGAGGTGFHRILTVRPKLKPSPSSEFGDGKISPPPALAFKHFRIKPAYPWANFGGGFSWHGFSWENYYMDASISNTESYSSVQLLAVPMWNLFTLMLILPTAWALRWLFVRLRERAGLCVACGYDLRATPERCPECGTIPPAAKGAAT